MNGNLLEKVTAYIDSHREEMLDCWRTLVEIEGDIGNKAGTDQVARTIAALLESWGVPGEIVPMEKAGDSLRAQWGSGRTGEPVLLIGHMDTVHSKGTLAEIPFRVEGGKVYGPGVLDMKGGLVCALYAMRALMEAGYEARPIRIAFTGDEEGGHQYTCQQSREFFETAAKGCRAALNFETGLMNGGVVVERKSAVRYRCTVHGVGSHAGLAPEKGRSAIKEMAHKVLAFEALSDYAAGTSVNTGTISGGTVPNAVPAECSVMLDIRTKNLAEAARIDESIRAIAEKCYTRDVTCTLECINPRPPMERTEGVMELHSHVVEAAKALGQPVPEPCPAGSWSDSTFVVAAGVPAICAFGVRGEWNHSKREYAVLESLYERAKLAAATILSLG